jgi:hypothetical protein
MHSYHIPVFFLFYIFTILPSKGGLSGFRDHLGEVLLLLHPQGHTHLFLDDGSTVIASIS